MIVEDALVINETCACEVVKAAVLASKADKAMVQQIVQTALAVAPKMSAVIAECAEAAAPGSGVEVASAQSTKGDAKNAANVLPAPAEPQAEGGSDFGEAWATNIRGVYLVQPAAAGFIVADTGDDNGDDHKGGGKKTGNNKDDDANDTDDNPVDRANSRRTRNLVALSPAHAVP